jgi:uncharacterized DUF497 family protein
MILLTAMVFVTTLTYMDVTFDPAKREATLAARGLDFADAAEVLAGQTFRFQDNRAEYGEVRMIAVGYLRGRMVVLVYTDRSTGRHIISMRKANAREQQRFNQALD